MKVWENAASVQEFCSKLLYQSEFYDKIICLYEYFANAGVF